MWTIKKPELSPVDKVRYDNLLRLYEIIKIPKDVWFGTVSNNKTAELVCDVSVAIFKCLVLMESDINQPLSVTEKDLKCCFRKPVKVVIEIVGND